MKFLQDFVCGESPIYISCISADVLTISFIFYQKVKESPMKQQPRTEKKNHLEVSVNHNLRRDETTGCKAGQIVLSDNIWKATGIISLQDRNLKVCGRCYLFIISEFLGSTVNAVYGWC